MGRVLKTFMAAADEGHLSAQYSPLVMYAEEIGAPLKNFCGLEKQQIRDSPLRK
jgi:TPR repeat protein